MSTEKSPATSNSCSSLLSKLSHGIIRVLEKAFYFYGLTVASRPLVFIGVSFAVTLLCFAGILNFKLENRPFKLWIPQDSDFVHTIEWQHKYFPEELRYHIVIYEAENVLDREVLLEMLRVHEIVQAITTEDATWESVCARLPSITSNFFGSEPESKKRKRETKYTGFDWSTFLGRGAYCSILENIDTKCMEHSILEIWGYDQTLIESLTTEDIITAINSVDTSAVYGLTMNFTSHLGNIKRDANGTIIKAAASRQIWVTQRNLTTVEQGLFHDDIGTGMEVDLPSFGWEKEFITSVLNNTLRPSNVNLYLLAASSYGTITEAAIMGDLNMLIFGFIVVFFYVLIMLGRFNLVEQRPILSFIGLSCVPLAVAVSYGICSLIGPPYAPLNGVLPFLLLGLGIDNMFVIMQSWNNLTAKEKKATLNERIAAALKHAGVSVTVTSVTDLVAFAIGSTTVLPGLRSFCLYAAVGIAAIYFFQITFFVAWFALDQKRMEDHRNGLFWCYKHENWVPNSCSRRDLCQSFFSDVYAKFLFTLPVKIIVICVTALMLGASVWGVYNLRQEFDPNWFLPQSSYLARFFEKQNQYYPSSGSDGVVYFANFTTKNTTELQKLEDLKIKLSKSPYIADVDSWYDNFKLYWEKQGYTVPDPELSEEEFRDQLSMFLFSPSGSKYRTQNFMFDGPLNCTEPAPPISAFSINYKHIKVQLNAEQSAAMEEVKSIVRGMNFSGYAMPWALRYSQWETDQILKRELYRNMGLAMLVVFSVTLVLLSNFSVSLMVLVCVFMTLLNVGALMHWWGLTIDIVSCVNLVLAIGLCVDYAAHIGHTFLTKEGTRNERARQTVATIGPAVLNGGLSTLIAFSFLANSDSHVISFFKIFSGVCVFGLYQGLVFLPVMLSIFGPAPYHQPELQCIIPADVILESTSANTVDSVDSHRPMLSNNFLKGECENGTALPVNKNPMVNQV